MNAVFKDAYEAYSSNAGAGLAARQGAQWVGEINDAIEYLQYDLQQYAYSKKTIETLSGDLAEHWHADTFNIDAILNGSSNRAHVPRSTGFATPDVVLKTGEQFQVKYYQDGTHSAKAQSISTTALPARPLLF